MPVRSSAKSRWSINGVDGGFTVGIVWEEKDEIKKSSLLRLYLSPHFSSGKQSLESGPRQQRFNFNSIAPCEGSGTIQTPNYLIIH